MKPALGKEVAAMLNIEAGEPRYYYNEEVQLVLRDGLSSTRIYVDGSEARLIVVAEGHRRGFRFPSRVNEKPETRFNWQAVHQRVEKCLQEHRP